MGKDSNIQWCDSTVNPVMGCDGCELWTLTLKHCYAGSLTENKIAKGPLKGWPKSFDEPTTFPGRMVQAAAWSDLRGVPRPDKPWIPLEMPRLVFISDMGDALSKPISFDYLKTEIVDVVRKWRHIGMWLTKQPKRMAEFSQWLGEQWPKNLWIGTSVTSIKTIGRIQHLVEVGDFTTTRFLSCEPLLGPLKLGFNRPLLAGAQTMPGPLAIHQVIVGGESGKDARPCNVEWLRDLRDQCFDVNLPFFCKQLGSHIVNGLSKPPLPPPWPNGAFFEASGRVLLRDSHGGKWLEWPSDLRIRQFPPIR